MALIAIGCSSGDDAPTEEDPRTPSQLLSQTPSFTRGRSPFSYTLTLISEDRQGLPYQQVTRGIYDGAVHRAALEVATTGEGLTDFTAATMVDTAARLLVVINGDEAFIRIDIGSGTEGPWRPLDSVAGEGPDASGTVTILNAALVGDSTQAAQVGEIGDTTIAGEPTTQYRIPAPVTEVTPFLPSEVLGYLSAAGFGREQATATTAVDVWIDSDGVTRRISINYLPLIAGLAARGFSEGDDISRYQLVWEVEQFGGVVVEVPQSVVND
ncbi:MAG: hypothetical protein ACI8TP_004328 [Acidimicrobiales bacterium]|jgi:hypothetical protein